MLVVIQHHDRWLADRELGDLLDRRFDLSPTSDVAGRHRHVEVRALGRELIGMADGLDVKVRQDPEVRQRGRSFDHLMV